MAELKTTRNGTPCARSRNDAWMAQVNESESVMRRILA